MIDTILEMFRRWRLTKLESKKSDQEGGIRYLEKLAKHPDKCVRLHLEAQLRDDLYKHRQTCKKIGHIKILLGEW